MKRSSRPLETNSIFLNAAGKGKLRGDPGCSRHAFFSRVQVMLSFVIETSQFSRNQRRALPFLLIFEFLQREDGGPQQNLIDDNKEEDLEEVDPLEKYHLPSLRHSHSIKPHVKQCSSGADTIRGVLKIHAASFH
jgi:hypothetical protein